MKTFDGFIEQISRNWHSSYRMDNTLVEVLQLLCGDLDLNHAYLISFESRSKRPQKGYEVRKDGARIAPTEETSVTDWIIRKAEELRKPFVAGNQSGLDFLRCEKVSHPAVPIFSLDKLVGLILTCPRDPALYDSNGSGFLTQLASYIAIIMRRSEYNQMAQRLYFSPQTLICGHEMFSVEKSIEKLANLSTPILISGETGVGKEIVARSLHLYSQRRNHPFLPINCAAINDSLLENELFGHVKGAFTGANDNREGLFEQADGGTIFFDEIGNMSWKMQQVLLRIVETTIVRKIGATKTGERRIAVRIVSATNRDLREMVKRREFSADLFYRLGLIGISVPPLRRRSEEIPILACHFLRETLPTGQAFQLSDAAFEALRAYSWPGNIRELKFVIERSASLAEEKGVIEAEHLDIETELEKPTVFEPSLKQKIRAFEQQCLVEALNGTGWNITRTAKQLNLSRRMLQIKLKHHRLAKPTA